MNRGPQDQVQQTVPNFSEYKLSVGHFALWQVTKILLLGAFFANLMFGFGLLYMIEGNDLGVENITTLHKPHNLESKMLFPMQVS